MQRDQSRHSSFVKTKLAGLLSCLKNSNKITSASLKTYIQHIHWMLKLRKFTLHGQFGQLIAKHDFFKTLQGLRNYFMGKIELAWKKLIDLDRGGFESLIVSVKTRQTSLKETT